MNEIMKKESIGAIGAALEANLVEQVKFYGKSPLVTFYDEKSLIRMITGLPSLNLNLIAGASLISENIDQQIENALAPFRKHKVPAIWWVGPSTIPNDLGSHLKNHGLTKAFDMLGMFYKLENLKKELEFPSGFTYKLVNNETTLRTWAETQTYGFEAQSSDTKHILMFENSLGTNPKSPWLRYIGYSNGEPVGTSILFEKAGVGAIFNVAIIPKYRRQGIGTFMTKIPLLKARSLGYKYGVLKASPMGVHLYRKMNFEECGEIGLYYLS